MSALCFWTAFAMIGSTCVFLGSCIVCGSSADRCTPVTLMLLIQHTCFSFSIYWDYALTVPLRQIVCIHCHQRCEYTAAFSPTHTHTQSVTSNLDHVMKNLFHDVTDHDKVYTENPSPPFPPFPFLTCTNLQFLFTVSQFMSCPLLEDSI